MLVPFYLISIFSCVFLRKQNLIVLLRGEGRGAYSSEFLELPVIYIFKFLSFHVDFSGQRRYVSFSGQLSTTYHYISGVPAQPKALDRGALYL